MRSWNEIKKAIVLLSVFWISSPLFATTDLNEILSRAKYDEGISEYRKKSGKSDGDYFTLGMLYFIDALENLTQDLYRLGLKSEFGRELRVPFLRLPVPENPDSEVATPAKLGKMLKNFYSDLGKAEKQLAKVSGDFKVEVDMLQISLDINGDGKAEEGENLLALLAGRNIGERDGDENFLVHFDRADAHWLNGYSHLLRAMSAFLLAHEGKEIFRAAGHHFFNKVKPEFTLRSDKDTFRIADLIAALHVAHMDVERPRYKKRTRENLLATIQESRLAWKYALAERDNDLEWFAAPDQRSVTRIRISEEQYEGWVEFLDMAEAVLNGERLIPHWRFEVGYGINLKKFFLDDEDFDLVLLVQGEAALEYREQGDVISRDEWSRITRLFRGDFFRYAVWIN